MTTTTAPPSYGTVTTGPDWQLHHTDALDLLDTITNVADTAGIIDATIVDPPYSSGGMYRGDRAASTRSKYVTTGAAHQLADFAGVATPGLRITPAWAERVGARRHGWERPEAQNPKKGGS